VATGRGHYNVGADERPGAPGRDISLHLGDRIPWRKPDTDGETPIEGADTRQGFGGAGPGTNGPRSKIGAPRW
jgi:hypothetical protein